MRRRSAFEQPFLVEFVIRLREAVAGARLLAPLHELSHAIPERDRRLVAEQPPGEGDIGEAMTDVPGAEPVLDRRSQRAPVEPQENLGHVQDRRGRARAGVDGPVVAAASLDREETRIDHIMDRYEFSALVAVLEDHRGLAVLDAALEDSRDPGVRVVQALSGSVDVEEAQRDGGDAVRPSRDQTQLLLVPFGDRVHAVRLERLRLRRRDGREARPAVWAVRLPVLPRELRSVPERRCNRTVGRPGVRAVAVDRHRGGDRRLLHAMLPFDEGLEKLLVASSMSIYGEGDRKSTRLNSSHSQISYAVFCLKKKKNKNTNNE